MVAKTHNNEVMKMVVSEIGGRCESNASCAIANAFCLNNACACLDGFREFEANTEGVKKSVCAKGKEFFVGPLRAFPLREIPHEAFACSSVRTVHQRQSVLHQRQVQGRCLQLRH